MEQVFKILDIALKISVVLFMVGNLLDMGLKLKLQDALGGLRNVRFVVQSVLWGFVLCPGLAYLLTKVVPLDPAYATGLVLLGMAPCAPFLPLMVERARGDMGAMAAFPRCVVRSTSYGSPRNASNCVHKHEATS